MIPSEEDELKRRQLAQQRIEKNLRRARYEYYAIAFASFLLGLIFLLPAGNSIIFYLIGTMLFVVALHFWDKGRKLQI